MVEYIKKERLLHNDAICKDILCSDCPFDDDINDFRCKLVRYIDDMPTIDIVHCSECIHASLDDGLYLCDRLNYWFNDDWFCADGERRSK